MINYEVGMIHAGTLHDSNGTYICNYYSAEVFSKDNPSPESFESVWFVRYKDSKGKVDYKYEGQQLKYGDELRNYVQNAYDNKEIMGLA